MAYTKIRDAYGVIRSDMILRDVDGACIPESDSLPWRAFLAWQSEGNAPAEQPPAPPSVPQEISDRQFAQVLAIDGVVTKPEALAWAARGELPQKLKDALAQIPEAGGQRFGAEMMLSAATMYERGHPLVPMLGGLLGYDAPALDDLWTRGAAL